jgi:hypothetical protein
VSPNPADLLFAQRVLEEAWENARAVAKAVSRQELPLTALDEANAEIETAQENLEAASSQLHLAEAAKVAGRL